MTSHRPSGASIEGWEEPKARVERLVAEGSLTREQVTHAETLWQDQWQEPIPMPNGEQIHVTERDVYHLIVDPRIARRPQRIELIVRNVYEIRETRGGRRRILSRWREEGEERDAFGILDGDRLWTAHLIRSRDVRKYRNERVLWKQ